MKSVLLLIALTILLCAAEEVKLPSSIQGIITKAEAAVAKNRAAYDAANDKPLNDAEKALKAELEKLIKAGKLDEAVRVKKLLESFRATIASRVDASATKGSEPDLLNVPGSIRVISAIHMAQGQTFDITEMVQDKFDADKKPFILDSKVFGDPVPGSQKTLTIVYTIDGKKKSATFVGWDTIDPGKF